MSTPENRTEFVQALRDRISKNNSPTSSHIAGAKQLIGFLDDALGLYSTRRPVTGLTAEIVLTAGSIDVPLPVDWLTENIQNDEILRSIEQGRDPNLLKETYSSLDFQNYGGFSSANPYRSRFGNSFDPMHANLSRPLRPAASPTGRPPVIRKWVSGAHVPVFVMRQAAGADRTFTGVRYNGRHRVEDVSEALVLSDSVNTIPVEHEPYVYEIMVGLAVKGRGFDKEANGGDGVALIERGQKIIDAALAKITPTSFRR